MTQDEIIEMASQASAFGYVYDAGDTPHLWLFDNKQLIVFAKLVAATEREANIKIIKETPFSNWFQACLLYTSDAADE